MLKYNDANGREGKPYTKILNKKISHYNFFKVTWITSPVFEWKTAAHDAK